MFKKIDVSYAYYVSECKKYHAYKKRWSYLYFEHFRFSDVYHTKVEWRIKLHAIEKALGLSESEKRL
jgi:hypothetical protein